MSTEVKPLPRVIWIWWRRDMHGNWFVKDAALDRSFWNGRTSFEDDRFECVRVEEIEQP